jgi:hypothetical protein
MALSEPRTGIHAIRVCDIAIIDVIFTLIAAVVLSRKNVIPVFIILILLSIIVHTVLGIKTKTNAFLFEEECE